MQPFSPEKLPIILKDKEHIALLKQVISTSKALEVLNQNILHLPVNEHLFSVFSIIEAVQSTKIEGTKTSFDEIMEAQVTKKETLDVIEANNYNKALQYGIRQILENKNSITNRMIKNLHKMVLKNSRGANRDPGNFRRIQNWIGDSKSKSYIPPTADKVPTLMSNLEKFINNNDFEPLIAAGIIHAQFETIHPFLDGNGRVGRLLIPLYLLMHNVCGNNTIFVSDELEKNKYKYYSLLNSLRNGEPQWYEWLSFFLTSIKEQAEKYLDKVDGIEQVILKYFEDEKIKKSTSAQKVLFVCVAKPITNSTTIALQSDLSLNTVNRWLKYFVDKKMLYTDSKVRNKIYVFSEVRDIVGRTI